MPRSSFVIGRLTNRLATAATLIVVTATISSTSNTARPRSSLVVPSTSADREISSMPITSRSSSRADDSRSGTA